MRTKKDGVDILNPEFSIRSFVLLLNRWQVGSVEIRRYDELEVPKLVCIKRLNGRR